MTTYPDSPLLHTLFLRSGNILFLFLFFFCHTELFIQASVYVCVWNWQSCLRVGRAHNYHHRHQQRGVSIYHTIHIHICSLVRLVIAILPQICSVCSTASLSIPLSPSHSSVLWLALWILLFFSLSFSRFLVLLLLASFHCAPKLTSSAPNYLRKLRVKSRQPVIYFTSIEVEKNQVAPEERVQRVWLVYIEGR